MNESTAGGAGTRMFGAGLVALCAGLAAALLFIPPPSHLALLAAGLASIALCGSALLTHGLRSWLACSILLIVGAVGAGAVLTVRGASADWPRIPLSLAGDDARCALELRGDLPADLFRRMSDALIEHPASRAIVLDSAGGAALAIERVAGLLREHRVDMAIAEGQCDSACAFLWVAAPRRYLVGARPRATVAFHAPHVWLPALGTLRAPLQDRRQREFLIQAGLPPWFVGWAYAPVEGVWRPDLEQLNRLGVATNFIQAARAADVSFCGAAPQLADAGRSKRSI